MTTLLHEQGPRRSTDKLDRVASFRRVTAMIATTNAANWSGISSNDDGQEIDQRVDLELANVNPLHSSTLPPSATNQPPPTGKLIGKCFWFIFLLFFFDQCAFRCVPDFFFLPSSFTQACAVLQSRLLPSRSSCCMVFADYDVSTPCARSSGLLSSADCQFSRASPFASCLHHHPPLAPSPSRHSSGGLLAT